MAAHEYQVEDKDWENLSTDQILWLIYSTFNKQRDDCSIRFYKIEKRKWVAVAAASVSGFLGGFSAVAAKMMIWK